MAKFDSKNPSPTAGDGEPITSRDKTPVSEETGVEAIYRLARAGSAAKTTPSRVVEPIPAAAAILWRLRDTEVEVYLVKRAATMSFVPGQWSFPGGKVAPEDHAHADPSIAAIIREVQEETGLRLSTDGHRFATAGRFITPSFSPIRFDAQFFLVEVAPDAVLDTTHSDGELDDGVWIRPSDALARWRRGEWLIPLPHRRCLMALEHGFDNISERCEASAQLENNWPRAFEIIPGIHIAPVRTPTLPPATHTNCYLIGAGDVVVIDPASPYEDERHALDEGIALLEARGHRVVEIWLTHHHADHIGGAAYLRDRLNVPVAAHARTAELCRGRVPVDRTLADGDVLELAGDPPRRLRVVFTPGHAPGHICVVEEHTRFMVAGDMVAGIGTIIVEPTEGNMGDYLSSLRRMKELAPAALLPAHGPTITAPIAKLDHYITHRLWREQRVLDALTAHGPARPSELVPTAYADVPPAIYPLAQRSLIAHLIKLAEDGSAVYEGDSWQIVTAD